MDLDRFEALTLEATGSASGSPSGVDLQTLVGPGHEVVQVEKEHRTRTEEIVMVNGTKIHLDGEEGERIKDCLLRGVVPGQDLLNHLLARAGLVLRPRQAQPHVIKSSITVTNIERTRGKLAVANSMGGVQTTTFGRENKVFSQDCRNDILGSNNDGNQDARSIPKAASPKRRDRKETSRGFRFQFASVLRRSPCQEELFSLLLWSRLYLTPSILVGMLLELDDLDEDLIFSTLSHWVRWFPEDFAEEAVMVKVRGASAYPANGRGARVAKMISSGRVVKLLSTLSSHLAALDRHQGFLDQEQNRRKHQRQRRDSISDQVDSPSSCCSPLDLSSSCLAQELTRIELEYLSFLSPAEFANVFAKDLLKEEDVAQETRDARQRASVRQNHFKNYTEWFNHLSYLVATTICRTRKKKARVRVVEHWIEVARKCINLANFNSLMGIITGLNMFPVARLTKTWHGVQSGKFAVLEHQMDPTSNFSCYRSTLTAAVVRSEGATDCRQRVVIPFFTLFVKDLYTNRERVNFSSETLDLQEVAEISKAILEFSGWRNVDCPYERNEQAAKFIGQECLDSEEALDRESFASEGPKTNMEKERFKVIQVKQ